MSFFDDLAVTMEQRYNLETESQEAREHAYPYEGSRARLLVDGLEVTVRCTRNNGTWWVWVDYRCVVRGRKDRTQTIEQTARAIMNKLPELAQKANEQAQQEAKKHRGEETAKRLQAYGVEGRAGSEEAAYVMQTYSLNVPNDTTNEAMAELGNIFQDTRQRLTAWKEKHLAQEHQ